MRWLWILFLAGGMAVGAPGQAKRGDLILAGPLAGGGGLVLAMNPSSGRVSTLLRTTGSERELWVGMMEKNRDLGLLTFLPGRPDQTLLRRLTVGGTTTTLAKIAAPTSFTSTNEARSAFWDPQGTLVLASGRGLYRYDPGQGRVVTLFAFPVAPATAQPLLQALALGPGPGSRSPLQQGLRFFALNARSPFQPNLPPPSGELFAFDPQTGRFTTLAADRRLHDATALAYWHAYPPALERSFVGIRTTLSAPTVATEVFRLGAYGRKVALFARLPGFQGLAQKITRRQTLYVAGIEGQGSAVYEVSLLTGQVLRRLRVPVAGFRAAALEIYGANSLHLTGGLDLSVSFSLQTNEPAFAGKNYLLLLAFDTSPPVTLTVGSSQVTLALAPDPLFMASLFAPGAVGLVNSQGTLDTMGNATASLTVNLPPTGGIPIYAAWIVYDGTTVLYVSETEMFLLP